MVASPSPASNAAALSTPTSNGHHHLGSPTKHTSPQRQMASSSHNRKSRSPTKQTPATPDLGKSLAPSSSLSPNTPSGRSTALGNLLHPTDEPLILPSSKANSANGNDEDEVDVTMGLDVEDDDERMDDEEDGEEAGGRADEEGGDGDDSEEDDEEDEEDDEDSGDESDDSMSSDIVVLDGADGEPTGDAPVARDKSVPADDAVKTEGDAPEEQGAEAAVNILQPKKKAKRRARSPSLDEDLPPPPPPMPTIRLETELAPEGDTLDWNFAEHAAQAGYAVGNAWGGDAAGMPGDDVVMDVDTKEPGTEAASPGSAPAGFTPSGPPPPGMSIEEVREMEEIARKLEEKYEDKPKKSRKRKVIDYDLNDPFIDDSDLKIDAPTHVARPKKDGFFVHQGPLELLEESPVKGKSRAKANRSGPRKEIKEPRKSLSEAVRDRIKEDHDGSRNSPIDLLDSDDDRAPPPKVKPLRRSPSPVDAPEDRYPVDRTLYKNASREPKFLPPFDEFPDEVAHGLRSLRRESAKHVWDPQNKGRFPEHLKVPLQRAGDAALRYDLLCIADKDASDSNYERYQERSFVTALCSVLPYNRLTLGKLVLKLCYYDYWLWLQACEAEGLRQWKLLLDPEIDGMIEGHKSATAEHTAKQNDVMEDEELVEDADAPKGKGNEPPKKQPVFNQDMKDIFKQLVENTQEMVDVNKKMEEWQQKIEGQSSELNMRKALYNRIIKMYPEGYMTSLHLSRAYTNYKRSGANAKSSGEKAAAAAADDGAA